MTNELLKGLEQSGDTILPRVIMCRRLANVLLWLDGNVDPRDEAGGTDIGDGVFTPKEVISGVRHIDNLAHAHAGSRPTASDNCREQQVRMLAHPGQKVVRMTELIKSHQADHPNRLHSALIAVGPEGGWTDGELETLESHAFHMVSLGVRPLTTSTACVAIVSLVAQLMEEA